MRVKICGITNPDAASAIAKLGATALGFICVTKSPRYVASDRITSIVAALSPEIACIGVFAGSTVAEIYQIVSQTNLSGVQLHGDESAEFCQQLRDKLPEIEIIKALRLKEAADLEKLGAYSQVVDTLLLDAYHPQMLGGTGKTIDWEILTEFRPPLPWLLAGGLTPENVRQALERVHPDGIDLSSGVERSPGDKDLDKVTDLFENIAKCR